MEGFALLVTSYWLATNYLISGLVEIAPDLPWITANMILASLPPLIASIYMMLRMRYIPPLLRKTQTLVAVLGSIVLAWPVMFLEALFLGKEMPLAQQMLEAKRYLHLMLFLLIVWGPL